MGGLPAAKGPIPLMEARARAFPYAPELEPTKAEHEATFEFLTRTLAANRDLIEGTILPANEMCSSGSCRVEWKDVPLLFDNNHPSLAASPFFAELIEQQLRGAR